MPQSQSRTHDDHLLSDRYGRRSKKIPRWLLYTAGGIALIGALAFFIWIAAHTMRPTAAYEEVSHSIVSDTEATITFNVNRPSDREASCVVVAENKLHAQVGWKEIEVAPSTSNLVQITVQLATSERASLVKVASCQLTNGT